RYLGDGVALVAAETPEIAARALDLIEVRYEPLPAVFDPREALKPEAPEIHPGGNLICHHKTRKGDVDAGFRESDIILEREYSTQRIEHAYIEPEAVLAEVIPDGSLTIWGSHQNIYSIRASVGRCLGLPLSRVRIVQPALGGSFGGKDDVMSVLSVRAGLLALMTGRPVKLVNTREESLIESYKRHPYYLSYKVGLKKDGTLQAMEIKIVADGGAYASMTPFVTWRSVVQATGPYRVPHVKTDVYGAYTNNVYTGAMRGFGSPQIVFASESLMDEIARELKMDPRELRRKNILRDGDITATGQRLSHRVSAGEVMEKASSAAGWEAKRARLPRENAGKRFQRGIGLAVSYRGVALGAEGVDATGAIVRLHPDASADVCVGLVEMGQGLKTVFCQIAAQELGLPFERLSFRGCDTSLIVDGGPTVASRSTTMGGGAVKKAATALRDKLLGPVAGKWKVPPEALMAEGGKIFVPGDPGRTMEYTEAVCLALASGLDLNSFAWHQSPPIWWSEEKGMGDAYFTYVYGCQVAEVEVDTETGKVDVLKVWAAHEVGKAINPASVRGQILGGVAMGMGYGLLEEVEVAKGKISTLNFDEYLIPTALDVRAIEPIIVENPDALGPYGAKCIGEPTCELAAPAIANAVAHATGKRIRDLPLNLERVLLGRKLSK
ncbi:MAG: xanthine dehydrogenase family protein molybdopterin-binding subunit, partial [Candidatus Aureabacteria bacterium]|nr:xanthine dehydrogenase family protein molybdopterin-binding subunit [Candidatus Auribacterota bacterium]